MKAKENGVTVKMRELGRTGIQVSSYCPGAKMSGRAAPDRRSADERVGA
ncbi:hypothetical protein [Nonomuraea sp. CA-141351]